MIIFLLFLCICIISIVNSFLISSKRFIQTRESSCYQSYQSQLEIMEDIAKEKSKNYEWFENLKSQVHHTEINPRDWSDNEYRITQGYQGTDFVHSPTAGVYVPSYILIHSDNSDNNNLAENKIPRLVGPCIFSSTAESHRGICHGGSMCALMDDALGWMGFCADGNLKIWSGYTVQVNTALRKSVKIGSILKIESWIDRVDGNRKVWVKAALSDPENGDIYCEGDGLFLKSLDVLE